MNRFSVILSSVVLVSKEILHKVWVLEQNIRYIVKEVGSKIRRLRNLSFLYQLQTFLLDSF